MWRLWKSAFYVLLVGLVLYCFIFISVDFLPWRLVGRRIQQKRVLLLCNTNHQELLKSGRDVLSQIPKDRLNPQSDGSVLGGGFSVPEGVQIPQAIRDIKPRRCLINYDGYLSVEVSTSRDLFLGVNIYPVEFKKPYRTFKYGDRELIPGLWYYDYEYFNNPEYDKRIDELIEEHKKSGKK